MNTFDELTRYGIVHLVPILQADSMEYMESLLKSLQPKWFLEIGTAIGRTAIDAAMTVDGLHVVTIEKDPEMAALARENIQKAGLEERVMLIEGDALETDIPHETYDLIFIDAAKGQYRRFFERYAPYLSEDGVIVSDNMFFHGLVLHPERTKNRHTKGLIKRLQRYREFLESLEDFETEILDTGDGIALTRRRKQHA
ncbi:O-methyltransferase [Erysipelotrichaceae bacterium RD49]|nr:O-methyltransferase [Erysipelotrichaceae bacterium RD49]